MCGGWICRVVMVVACCAGLRMGLAQEAKEIAVERWGVAEVMLKGPAEGNPFVDVTVSAKFTLGEKSVECGGVFMMERGCIGFGLSRRRLGSGSM